METFKTFCSRQSIIEWLTASEPKIRLQLYENFFFTINIALYISSKMFDE